MVQLFEVKRIVRSQFKIKVLMKIGDGLRLNLILSLSTTAWNKGTMQSDSSVRGHNIGEINIQLVLFNLVNF